MSLEKHIKIALEIVLNHKPDSIMKQIHREIFREIFNELPELEKDIGVAIKNYTNKASKKPKLELYNAELYNLMCKYKLRDLKLVECLVNYYKSKI